MAKKIPKFDEFHLSMFKAQYKEKGKNDCWPFEKMRDKNGYGRFYYRKSTYRAHRIAYKLYFGIDPCDLLVCHTCDNPSCVNPKHLFLGTNNDNIQDMLQKGRQKCVLGEEARHSKFKNDDIKRIRDLAATGKVTIWRIAADFGTSKGHIRNIVKGERWRHLPVKEKIDMRKFKIGELSNQSKLTEKQVKKIRDQKKSGNFTYKILAEMYGVTPYNIQAICLRKTWKHI